MSTASSSAMAGSGAGVPHLDIDPFSIEFFDDLHPAQERMREAGPLIYLDAWKQANPDFTLPASYRSLLKRANGIAVHASDDSDRKSVV